jgi:hypothetical protein
MIEAGGGGGAARSPARMPSRVVLSAKTAIKVAIAAEVEPTWVIDTRLLPIGSDAISVDSYGAEPCAVVGAVACGVKGAQGWICPSFALHR